MEDAPNKQVHAEDLASKLSQLTGRMAGAHDDMDMSNSPAEQFTVDELSQKLKHTRNQRSEDNTGTPISAVGNSPSGKIRSRSSTLIYDPKAHGDSPGLPAVMLETEDEVDDLEEEDERPKKILAHTSRPPLELLHQA